MKFFYNTFLILVSFLIISISNMIDVCAQNISEFENNYAAHINQNIKINNPNDSIIALDSIKPEPYTWIVKSAVKDNLQILSSPIRFKKKDFLFWTPVLASTLISIKYDEEIYKEFKSFQNKHSWVDVVSPIITTGGDKSSIILCSTMYLSGLIFKQDRLRRTAGLSAQAMLSSGIVVVLLKATFSRQRPSISTKDYWHWFPSYLNIFLKKDGYSNYDSFPSGHTITAFSFATVVAKQYKDSWLIPPLAYTLATGVALSRITEDTHWFSDVIMGGALGYCIGNYISKKHSTSKWTLLPTISKRNYAFTVNYKI